MLFNSIRNSNLENSVFAENFESLTKLWKILRKITLSSFDRDVGMIVANIETTKENKNPVDNKCLEQRVLHSKWQPKGN